MTKSIKREQEVVVITGAHKGQRGKIIEVRKDNRVLIEDVNLKKTLRVHQLKEKHQSIILI